MSSSRKPDEPFKYLLRLFEKGDLDRVIKDAENIRPDELLSFFQLPTYGADLGLLETAAKNKHQALLNYCFNIFIKPHYKAQKHIVNWAVLCSQSVDTVTDLLRQGAEINEPFTHFSSHSSYSYSSHIEVTKGRTPLEQAIKMGNIGLVTFLSGQDNIDLIPYGGIKPKAGKSTVNFRDSRYYSAVRLGLASNHENKIEILEHLYTLPIINDDHIKTALLALRHAYDIKLLKHFNELMKLNYEFLCEAMSNALQEYAFYGKAASLQEPILYIASQPRFFSSFNPNYYAGSGRSFDTTLLASALHNAVKEWLAKIKETDTLFPLAQALHQAVRDQSQASGSELTHNLLVNLLIQQDKNDQSSLTPSLVPLIDQLLKSSIQWPSNAELWKKALSTIKQNVTGIAPVDPATEAKISKWKIKRADALNEAHTKRAENSWLWSSASPDSKKQDQEQKNDAPEQELKDMSEIRRASQAHSSKKN